MKKICIILPKGLPVPAVKGGAIETLISNLIDVNEEEKKIKITICATYDKKAEKKQSLYKYTDFINVKKNFLYIVNSLKSKIKKGNVNTNSEYILEKIKDKNFDYVIVEGGPQNSFESYKKFFKKDQLILHLHHNEKYSNIAEQTFGRFLFVSEYIKQDYVKNAKKINCNIIKNGIDINKFMKSDDIIETNALKEQLEIKKEDYVLIYCGRLIEGKGVLELCKAFNLINEKNLKLLIIGSPEFSNNAESEYTKLIRNEVKKSENKIKLLGYQSNEEIYKYYNIAHLGIVPSKLQEAAGLIVIEMLLSGLNILTTGTGGIKEYLGKYGNYISNDEKIIENLASEIQQIKNKSKKEKHKKSERINYAKQFNKYEMYYNLLEILER